MQKRPNVEGKVTSDLHGLGMNPNPLSKLQIGSRSNTGTNNNLGSTGSVDNNEGLRHAGWSKLN